MSLEKGCRLGDTKMISTALENGEDINQTDGKIGWTPLYRSVVWNHTKAVSLLLKMGARTDIGNKASETALHKAVEQCAVRIIKMLLQYRADVNAQDIDGNAPLHIAAQKGNMKWVSYLLKLDAKINLKTTKTGKTALHFAVEKGDLKIAEVLIQNGASIHIEDNSQNKPIDLAWSPDMKSVLLDPPKRIGCTPNFLHSPAFGWDDEEEYHGSPIPNDYKAKPWASIKSTESFGADNELEVSFGSPRDMVVEVDQSNVVQVFQEENPALQSWLKAIELGDLYEPLLAAGYDDINMMVEQMKSHMPITTETLSLIGVTKPGHQARFLAHLTVQGLISKSQDIRESCCKIITETQQDEDMPTLQEWLNQLHLSDLYLQFEHAGYESYEQIIFLMNTNFAINDKVLEKDVGIKKPGYRHRILIRLQQDAVGFKQHRKLEVEGESTKAACELCNLM